MMVMVNHRLSNCLPAAPYYPLQGDVRVIDFSSITSMYGSVHCASQVIKRVPRRLMRPALHE